ncbi:unnamed protein product [Scytosiphon promiscuus]
MRETTRGVGDALPVRPSASASRTCVQNAGGEVDGDSEAGFNPAWMIPDRSGRFCWYKKKQTEGSLTHTLQTHVDDRDDDDYQHPQAGLAEATHVSNSPPSLAEVTSCESPTIDRPAEQAAGWLEATSGGCIEYKADGDAPILERDDSFSRMLAHARLARKRTRESPIPEITTPSPQPLSSTPYPRHPGPHLPLSRRANDAMGETAPVGHRFSASQSRPLSPVYGTPGDKRRELQVVKETFSTPEIQRLPASETLSPMSDAVAPTAWTPLPPPAELPRPKERRQPLHVSPLRFWSTSTTHTDADESKQSAERPASAGSLPPRFSSLRQGREQAPVDNWAMFDAAVPKMSPPSARRDDHPGGQAEPLDGAERVSNAPTSRSKLDEKRAWERPVPGESAAEAMPPVLCSPLPQVSPLVPMARRQSPRNVQRNATMGCGFPSFSEELLTLPSPLRAPSPPRGHPQHKRARDSSAWTSSPRPPPPPSPPCKPRDLHSAGWSQERTSTGALFWYNRVTGQLSHRKPSCLPVCQ